jgi:hypothetical protein
MLTDAMHKSNLMNNLLHYMLETPKALSTNSFYIVSENLKDETMDNQQETKVLYLAVYLRLEE